MQRERRLRNLMNDVEELLGELSTEANPDVQELRRRIADAIGDTKRAIAEQGHNATARIGQYHRLSAARVYHRGCDFRIDRIPHGYGEARSAVSLRQPG